MARNYSDYLDRGAKLAAIVIDSPGQNAAMVEKLLLNFPILSDPEGLQAAKPFELWDSKERMAIPAVVVLTSDGEEVYRYAGTDFADRPVEVEVIEALDRLALPPITEAIHPVPTQQAKAGQRAISLHDLGVYMRGVRSSSDALSGRLKDAWDRQEASRTKEMSERYIAAQAATTRLHDRVERDKTA